MNIAMLKTGDFAPDFVSKGFPDGITSLYKFLKKGPLVLFFYPKDESAGCTAQACSLRDAYEDFQDAGANVIGVSADSDASHEAFSKNHRLPFSLISDPDFKVHTLFGAQPGFLGLRQRITYVIGQDGKIHLAFSSLIRIGKHMELALDTINKLKAAI